MLQLCFIPGHQVMTEYINESGFHQLKDDIRLSQDSSAGSETNDWQINRG
jgi:hypothetical protein